MDDRIQSNLQQQQSELQQGVDRLAAAIDDHVAQMRNMRHRMSKLESVFTLMGAALRAKADAPARIAEALSYLQVIEADDHD